MAEIIPFKGILYNMSKVLGEDVVAPPYDIITPEYKETLYNKSRYNIVRIDFGKELEGDNESENKYTRASNFLNSWLKDGILTTREKSGFYAYEVEYEIKNQRKKLRGFFCLVKLVELGKGVYPHECTHSKPKADRLNIMKACNANTSPIFSLYNSPQRRASTVIEETIKQNKPYMEAHDPDSSAHRLWIIEDKSDIDIIVDDIKDKAIFIADGHHRYETALEFQKEMKMLSADSYQLSAKSWDYVLMFLANMSDEGLTILPAHRLVRGMPENSMKILSEYFYINKVDASEDIEGTISGHKNTIGFCQCDGSQQYILKHRGGGLDDVNRALKGLDVIILHELIFKKLLKITNIAYEMNVETALNMIEKGLYDAVFFLNPTRVEDVEKVALSDVRMPPKSTYFYPKLLTGMVIYKF
jgi:uncharacterized protein (DUF1015 family)